MLDTIRESQSSLDSGANSGEVGMVMDQVVERVLAGQDRKEQTVCMAASVDNEGTGAERWRAAAAGDTVATVSGLPTAGAATGSAAGHQAVAVGSEGRGTWDSATSSRNPEGAVALEMPCAEAGIAPEVESEREEPVNKYCCSDCRSVVKVGRRSEVPRPLTVGMFFVHAQYHMVLDASCSSDVE